MKSLAVVFWLTVFFAIPGYAGQMAGDRDVRNPGARNGNARDTMETALGREETEMGREETDLESKQIALLQSLLQNTETAVLSYAAKAGELQVRAITAEGVHSVSLPAGSVFFSRVLAFKNSLKAREGFDRSLAHELYKKLIIPVKANLHGKTHLVVIPCKNIGLIPFAALVPDTASNRYLLHDYAVSYSYDIESLIRPAIVLSDYDRQKVLAVAPFNIPSAEKEIMNIKADHLLGKAASLDRFLEKARNYSIIHLTTYATITDSANSFIVFSQENAKPVTNLPNTNPKLFIEDIGGLNLEKVSLIVLSPCQPASSNLGDTGVFSMAGAFGRAGCHNFITSLWQTDPEATLKISMKLHQYIHKGEGYAQALQKARINYLENPAVADELKSPGYWAGFILLGEINTIPQSHKIFYYFALAFAVLVVVYILRRKNHCYSHADRQEHSQTIR